LSRKTQRIEKERYESGVSTINDFLLSIAQLELARAKTIQSKYNYQEKYLLLFLSFRERSKIDVKKNIDYYFYIRNIRFLRQLMQKKFFG